MNYSKAMNTINRYTNPQFAELHNRPTVDFVSPVVATVLAAAAIRNPSIRDIELDQTCQSYAETTGLTEALQNVGQPTGQTGPLHGKTYSRLTKLRTHDEVDGANSVIGDLLHQQLGAGRFTNEIQKVVGELHDNVASHANGIGFSAAQVYGVGQNRTIEFAIADGGCGLLVNAQRVSPVSSDEDAILWSLEKGNTSAPPRPDMAQRLPDDYIVSPLPPKVPSFSNENHHVGEGLYTLTELVRHAGGKLWIWSGKCSVQYQGGIRTPFRTADYPSWEGLAIEVELPLASAETTISDRHTKCELDAIAAKLGL